LNPEERATPRLYEKFQMDSVFTGEELERVKKAIEDHLKSPLNS
jgi:hypothetical protein